MKSKRVLDGLGRFSLLNAIMINKICFFKCYFVVKIQLTHKVILHKLLTFNESIIIGYLGNKPIARIEGSSN